MIRRPCGERDSGVTTGAHAVLDRSHQAAAGRRLDEQGKPVVLGETAPLLATPDAWRSFLTGARELLDGYPFFYDGRSPRQAGTSPADAWYAAALDQFLELRGSRLGYL